ncbi:hypothetical protein DPEC_G00031430 [Dallia pectoralis]|uniref:Uncharacterized protein n=1 Tax=Dallia pectoralis TaxID=75939 RepID=A0ACC2HDP0_DALPE|nr:hypothetical protein DPEC_G00031430 [Dallia pectoralis]
MPSNVPPHPPACLPTSQDCSIPRRQMLAALSRSLPPMPRVALEAFNRRQESCGMDLGKPVEGQTEDGKGGRVSVTCSVKASAPPHAILYFIIRSLKWHPVALARLRCAVRTGLARHNPGSTATGGLSAKHSAPGHVNGTAQDD